MDMKPFPLSKEDPRLPGLRSRQLKMIANFHAHDCAYLPNGDHNPKVIQALKDIEYAMKVEFLKQIDPAGLSKITDVYEVTVQNYDNGILTLDQKDWERMNTDRFRTHVEIMANHPLGKSSPELFYEVQKMLYHRTGWKTGSPPGPGNLTEDGMPPTRMTQDEADFAEHEELLRRKAAATRGAPTTTSTMPTAPSATASRTPTSTTPTPTGSSSSGTTPGAQSVNYHDGIFAGIFDTTKKKTKKRDRT